MKTNAFFYDLPSELIAQSPSDQRANSRMMVIDRQQGSISHHHFHEIVDLLTPDDLVVVNDTKVIPARVYGQKAETGGRVEMLFLEERSSCEWEVLLRASKRPKPGQMILFGRNNEANAQIIEEGTRGKCVVKIETPRPLLDILDDCGEPPLPPYIQRESEQPDDRSRYQTVYADKPGAVAAPTAGLHFTPDIFDQLAERNIERATVTLHVGLGTFRPVTCENLEDHPMEAERYEVPASTAERVNATKAKNGNIVAVGSTSIRTLETAARSHLPIQACEGRSDLFIYPPAEFSLVNRILTNFHLPESTLIMLVCAFGGTELMMEAYHKAIEEKYRFYSYGDCMLVL